jgi:hypothetical protein
MNKLLFNLPQSRWARRLLWALLGVLLLWLVTWLGVPPLLKWQLEKQATAALGRNVTVERVDFRPWSLEIAVEGLRVANAAGDGEQFSLARFHADAELQSLFRLAPVVDALVFEQPRLTVRHLGEGRYDVDDVLQRLRPKDDAPPSDPTHFALFNIKLSGGELVFVDDSVGATHRLSELALGVPFLSNLPSRQAVVIEPHLAFVLNGSAFDSRASSTPFAQTRDTDASVDIPALDLAPYLPYWPAQWPVKPEAGVLQLALKLAFEQQDTPRLSVSGTAALSGLRVVERVGPSQTAELLAWERLGLTLNRVEPLARQVDLAAIELKAPSLTIARDGAGLLNLQRIAQAWGPSSQPPASPAPMVALSAPAASPWQVSVARVDLDGGTIQWSDAAVQPASRLALEALRVQVQTLRWPMQAPVPFEVSARLGQTPLSIQGTATDAEAQAKIALGELPLTTLAPYAASVLVPALEGRLAADLQLDWRAAKGDQPMGLAVNATRIDLNELRLGPSRQPLASLRSLQLQDTRLDLAASTAVVGKLVLTRPQLRAQRDKDGRWMVDRWLKPSRAAADPVPAPAQPSPWQLTLADVQIDAGAATLEDLALSRPVQLDLSQIKLQVKNLQPLARSQPDMPVSLQLRMGSMQNNRAEPGRVSMDGTLRLPGDGDALRTKLKVQAERLPVHALEPYFGDRLNLDLLRADTSYRGTVEAAMPPAGLRLMLAGNAALDDFRANTLSPAEDLLAWKSLQVRGLQLAMAPGQVTKVSVDETVLSDYFARLIIDETGRINLQGLVRQESDAPAVGGTTTPVPATPPTPAPPTASASPNPDIRFGPISLVNGRVLFSDRFIKPNYSANLSELTGSLSAFASVPPGGAPQMADLALRGRAEGTAALEIDGKLNPLAQPLALDIRGRVRNLELPPLSPYTVKYAGYGIERGKLSVDVAYKIEPNGQLTASNQIILNQLSFGDRVAGSDAPNLPVKLAVALLADRNGVIDINLPVSGSLNDPQFRLAPLIFRLIVNLIGKAVTAPFSLIANAFGGGGEEMNQVAFTPGSKQLDDAARQRLDAVAKALTDRPALQITVVGHSDLEAERSGYQRARLDERVLAEKRRTLAREGAAVSDAITVSPGGYPALLKEVYRRADIPKPRNLVGLAKDVPQAEMEALLLASIPVTADALRELAVARGVAVKDYLASRQLAEERMFLGAPQLASQGEKWRPQAELKLAPR